VVRTPIVINVEEHVGDADGKALSASVPGKRKHVDEVVRKTRVAHRQQAAPVAVQGQPFEAPRGNGNHQIPNLDTEA
jgi:hypothetical protein